MERIKKESAQTRPHMKPPSANHVVKMHLDINYDIITILVIVELVVHSNSSRIEALTFQGLMLLFILLPSVGLVHAANSPLCHSHDHWMLGKMF